MKWKGIRHRAEYIAFRLVVCLLQILTPNQSARLARGLAVVLTDWLPRRLTRYDVARETLQAAFPVQLSQADVRRMIRAMRTRLFGVVAESVRLPRRVQLNRVHEVIRFRNHGLVVRALCSGRPVILLSGHFGNWEMAVAVFGLFGFPMGVVARELDNPHLNRWFRRFRQSTGHVMLAKKGGYDDMLALIGRKGHLAMLGDQDAGGRGLFVDFFGRPASTFKSIALLALEYRALICVGYAYRLPDDPVNQSFPRFELGCEAMIDPDKIESNDPVGEVTRQYTAALQRAIERAPEQYFWVHRRWKSQPAARRSRSSKAA